MNLKVFALFAFLPFFGFANAQDDSGIIHGKNYSFTLTAPKGWVLDDKSGRSQGLQAVFYPNGSSWKDGSAVMYENVHQKSDPTKDTIKTVIDDDISDFKQASRTVKTVDADPIPTRTDTRSANKKAVVKYFIDDQNGTNEAVAYVDEKDVVVMLVLSARNQQSFKASFPAFKEFVGSYFFLGTAPVHQ